MYPSVEEKTNVESHLEMVMVNEKVELVEKSLEAIQWPQTASVGAPCCGT